VSSMNAQEKAERYLKDQAKIIKKYGGTAKLHGEKYKEAVSATKRTFQLMSNAREVVVK
jgi:hypothetical protein